jgi:hypothetical protein
MLRTSIYVNEKQNREIGMNFLLPVLNMSLDLWKRLDMSMVIVDVVLVKVVI